MSRIGKQPIKIPSGVEIEIKDGSVMVKGPLGALTENIRPEVSLKKDEGFLNFSVDTGLHSKYWGLTRTIVNNMILGVTKGFTKSLEIIGIGYKVDKKGEYLIFNLGYSHEIWYEIPTGISAEIKDTKITLTGSDKQKVGQSAAVIRSFRKPEPYKGKGIKYIDEIIKRKAGKAGKK